MSKTNSQSTCLNHVAQNGALIQNTDTKMKHPLKREFRG